jgi:hypothetical protein
MYNLQYDHDGRLMLVRGTIGTRSATIPGRLKWWSAMAGCRDCTPRARSRSKRRRIARRSRPAGRSGAGGAD